MNYVKLFVDTLRQYQRLSDAEFGRALRAVLQYLEDGTEAQLPGKECIMYDVLREQVERDRKSYAKKVSAQRENGSKGGRPRKSQETQQNPWVFKKPSESQETQEKEKEKESYTREGFLADDEADAIMAGHQQVFDEAERCGFARNTGTLDALTDMIGEYGVERMLAALQECLTHGATTLAYLRAVLQGKPKPSAPEEPRLKRLF